MVSVCSDRLMEMICIHVVSCLETEWDNVYNILFLNIIYVYGGGEIYFPSSFIIKIKSMIVACRPLWYPTLVERCTPFTSLQTVHILVGCFSYQRIYSV